MLHDEDLKKYCIEHYNDGYLKITKDLGADKMEVLDVMSSLEIIYMFNEDDSSTKMGPILNAYYEYVNSHGREIDRLDRKSLLNYEIGCKIGHDRK